MEFNDSNVCKRQLKFLQDIAGCKCRTYGTVIIMKSERLDMNLRVVRTDQVAALQTDPQQHMSSREYMLWV